MILRALENSAPNRCVKTLTDVDVFEFRLLRLSFTLLLLGRKKGGNNMGLGALGS